MEIKDVRPEPAAPVSPISSARDDARQTSGGSDRGAQREDRVEISEHGRALAHHDVEPSPTGTLAGDRLMDVRRRVQTRFYDRPEIAEEVARRIIERGDL